MMKILLLSAVGALSAAVSIPVANATVLAVIGQVSDTDQVTATVLGGVTTISSSTSVDITAIDAPISVPITATLDLTATSVGTAALFGGNVSKPSAGRSASRAAATTTLAERSTTRSSEVAVR
jgi:hypothetical protein